MNKELSVKRVVEIGKQYGYKFELVKGYPCIAKLRISSPYYRTPYSGIIDSCYCNYAFVKRVFDSLDNSFKI